MSITHEWVATQADGADATLLRPQAGWNRPHVQTGVYDVLCYGENTTPGTTNMSPAFQAAVDAATAAGEGTVLLPPEVCKLNTAVTLPHDITTKLRVLGQAGTVLKPLAGCFLMAEDGELYQNIEIGCFDVDGSAITLGNGGGSQIYAMIGSANNAMYNTWSRFSFENLYIHDIFMRDLPNDQTQPADTVVWGVGIYTHWRDVTLRDILVERVHVRGGNSGFVFNGADLKSDATGVPSTGDNITIRDCSHIIATPATATYNSSNVQIGERLLWDRVTVLNFYAENSGDDFIEINNAQRVLCDNCVGLNPFIGGFVFINFEEPTDIPTQQLILRDCRVTNTKYTNAPKGSFGIGIWGGTYGYGTLLVDGFEFNTWGYGNAVKVFSAGTISTQGITLRNVKANYDFDLALTAGMDLSVINLDDDTAPVHSLIEGLRTRFTGTVTTDTGNCNATVIWVGGPDSHYVIRDCRFISDATIAAGSNHTFLIGYQNYSTDKVGQWVENCIIPASGWAAHTLGAGTADATHRVVDMNCSWLAAYAIGGYVGRVNIADTWENFGLIVT